MHQLNSGSTNRPVLNPSCVVKSGVYTGEKTFGGGNLKVRNFSIEIDSLGKNARPTSLVYTTLREILLKLMYSLLQSARLFHN